MEHPSPDDLIAQSLHLVESIARNLSRGLPPSIDFEDLRGAGLVGLVTAARRFDPDRGVPFGAFARQRIRGAMIDSCRRRRYADSLGEPLGTDIQDPADPDQAAELAERHAQLSAAIGRLPERERILIRAQLAGEGLAGACGVLQISQSRGYQLARRALTLLRQDLTAANSCAERRLGGYEVVMAAKAKATPISKKPTAAERAAEIKRRAGIVDQLGELEADLAAAAPLAAKVKLLKAEIQGWADAEFPANQPVVFEGQRYTAVVSAKGNKRRFLEGAMSKIFDFLGKVKFLSLCSLTLDAADKSLSPAQMAEVVAEDKAVGPRTVKSMARAVTKAA